MAMANYAASQVVWEDKWDKTVTRDMAPVLAHAQALHAIMDVNLRAEVGTADENTPNAFEESGYVYRLANSIAAGVHDRFARNEFGPDDAELLGNLIAALPEGTAARRAAVRVRGRIASTLSKEINAGLQGAQPNPGKAANYGNLNAARRAVRALHDLCDLQVAAGGTSGRDLPETFVRVARAAAGALPHWNQDGAGHQLYKELQALYAAHFAQKDSPVLLVRAPSIFFQGHPPAPEVCTAHAAVKGKEGADLLRVLQAEMDKVHTAARTGPRAFSVPGA
jgi:hypothetical protein